MEHLQYAINYFVEVLQLLILVRIVLSFIIRDPYNKIYRIVHQLTEPIMAPFRKLIHKLGIDTGMFDFSPLLAMISLQVLAGVIIGFLRYLGYA